MRKIFLLLLAILTMFACKNQDWDFPDFEYSAVYFAYQTPVRTITLGEDIFNTELDNDFKFEIMATWGGGYTNRQNVIIDIVIDESLCDDLTYSDNSSQVFPMPSAYYTLESNQIVIEEGKVSGGVKVQLDESFFEDSLSLSRNYVIPMVMSNVEGADSILTGDTDFPGTSRVESNLWNVTPKDYVLYAVQFINKWDANYLRRGHDIIITDGVQSENTRRAEFVESDEINSLNTLSLTEVEFPLSLQDSLGIDYSFSLILSFDSLDGNECKVIAGDNVVSASGTGKFVKRGDKNSWGNKDRDVIYLDYEYDLGTVQIKTKDTLVVRDRGVAFETFTPVVNR
jgi:hypothetical protein